jgi:biofilm PGA synthesis N-glycosyltransferase PgaC
MQIIWIVTLTFLVLYIYRILHFYSGWKRIKEFRIRNREANIPVSVIIPVRDEEHNIKKLLGDISEQDYPQKLLEIILVNDHSTDFTSGQIRPYCDKYSNIRLIELDNNLEGKKAAINTGVRNSAGEIIVTTDADCRIGKSWISAIVAYYIYCSKPAMIIGLVDMHSNGSLFSKFQQFELTALIASGVGAAGMSRPLYCNGANLIYRKDVYLKYTNSLNTKTASGDDTLFMLKVKKDLRHEIKVLKSGEAVVYTKPQKELWSFIRQRIRWTSKSKYYRDFDILSSAIIVLAMNISVVISLVMLIILKSYLLFPCLLIAKTITDLVFIRKPFEFFNKQKLIKYLIPFQFVYPFYISITGILGNVIGYSWKGRKYR